ncbi:SH3 domain-containing YSC84-like protein 1 isoform X2 [Scophthalmus maximus]|uniref:SH3 domain-containing YSC84-like protein 1 isoform X2 n=1 Tax=Scophthalmus maximus TaxID=52904 RepID=UPI001FA87B95|nr:SH3 domain-containing YSC84-like protein 1 isoform X2 [Scophthalmus maximus]
MRAGRAAPVSLTTRLITQKHSSAVGSSPRVHLSGPQVHASGAQPLLRQRDFRQRGGISRELQVRRGEREAEAPAAHLSTGKQPERRTKRRGGIKMSNPIPSNLKSEAKKAAKILTDFTEISSRNGPDKLIPPHVIAKAEGLAIISVIKAGFMITARGGSGIVIARLADRRWSAPSAIGIAGLGGGFEIGVEVSDLVIILNQRRAIEAFTKGGNLTLGGNCTVAVGPMGRNVEADVVLRSTAAVFTYCRSRGLFAGISLEGSYLLERKETNRKFYTRDIRASAILNGDVEPPSECYALYHILDAYAEAYTADWTSKNKRSVSTFAPSRPPAPPQQRQATSYQQPATSHQQPATSYQQPATSSGARPGAGSKNALYPSVSVYKSETSGGGPSGGGASGQLVVTATHPFTGQQPGDLSFVPGDRITVITKTDSHYDWWEGQLNDGRVGIFPANFVTY